MIKHIHLKRFSLITINPICVANIIYKIMIPQEIWASVYIRSKQPPGTLVIGQKNIFVCDIYKILRYRIF